MKASEHASFISGSGSESLGHITVFCPCNDGVIKAYDKHGNIVFSIPHASGMCRRDITLPAGDYRMLYLTDPLEESGELYEGTLTVIA